MATLDVSAFSNVLKTLYPQSYMNRLVYENNPFLGMVPKYTKFGGNNLRISLQYGVPQGRSASFAKAQANKTTGKYEGFLLTRVRDYSLASIDGETIEASQGDSNSLVRASKAEFDGALHSIKRSLATSLFRSGSGSMGQVSAGGTSGTTLTLLDPNDIVNFEVGMTLVASSTDGGGTIGTVTEVIDSLDRDNGTMDVASGTWDAEFAASYYIFVEGDHDAKLSGLDAWIPATVTSTSFFGVDRTKDTTRLGGVRVIADAAKDGDIQRTLIRAAARVAREGGSPDCIMVNHDVWQLLVKEIGLATEYNKRPAVDGTGKQVADIAYKSIVLQGPTGSMDIIPDHNCQRNLAWMLQLNTWKCYSLNEAPHFLNLDGRNFLREASADSYEARIGYYAQLGCSAPGWNCRVDLTNVLPAAS